MLSSVLEKDQTFLLFWLFCLIFCFLTLMNLLLLTMLSLMWSSILVFLNFFCVLGSILLCSISCEAAEVTWSSVIVSSSSCSICVSSPSPISSTLKLLLKSCSGEFMLLLCFGDLLLDWSRLIDWLICKRLVDIVILLRLLFFLVLFRGLTPHICTVTALAGITSTFASEFLLLIDPLLLLTLFLVSLLSVLLLNGPVNESSSWCWLPWLMSS